MRYLEAFLANYQNRKTQKEYEGAIQAICTFCQKDFHAIEKEDALAYFSALQSRYRQQELSLKTIYSRISICHCFSEYIRTQDDTYKNPFPYVLRPSVDVNVSLKHIPSLEELDHILGSMKQDPMLFLILTLAFRMTLSASDILSIRRCHIVFEEEKYFIYLPLKKEQSILVPSDVSILLEDYLQTHTGAVLFHNKWGNPMTLRNLDASIKRYVEPLGYSYTLKDLRNRGVLEMLRVTQESDLDLVARYANVSNLRLRQFANALQSVKTCPAEYTHVKVVHSNE